MSEKKKILWIEDDYYHLQGLTRELSRNGFEIIPAKSYEQALEELNKHKDELCFIILDLIIPCSLERAIEPSMPEEEYEETIEEPKDLVEYGMELLKHIKNELKPTIPMIVLTIVRTEEILKELENNGVRKEHKLGLMPNKLKEIVFEELYIK